MKTYADYANDAGLGFGFGSHGTGKRNAERGITLASFDMSVS